MDDVMTIDKKEARTLVFWLDLLNGKWRGGSNSDVLENTYNKMSLFIGSRKYWKWKR